MQYTTNFISKFFKYSPSFQVIIEFKNSYCTFKPLKMLFYNCAYIVNFDEFVFANFVTSNARKPPHVFVNRLQFVSGNFLNFF